MNQSKEHDFISPAISLVIPLLNEEENIQELHRRIQDVFKEIGSSHEIIYINDGSTDSTLSLLLDIKKKDPTIHVIDLMKNYGQTAALAAGFDKARGEIIISMDGDLQHDPADIPRLLSKIEEGYDIVSGWRKDRVDNLFIRRIPSRIANWLMSKLSGVDIHDFGTTLKAYRANTIKSIKLYGDFHRFIPALSVEVGAKITEIPITNIERQRGKSSYGLMRTFTVLFDLLRIKFFISYFNKPLQVFGFLGLCISCIGAIALTYLIILKFGYHISIMETRAPMFMMSTFLIMFGVNFFIIGILGEMMVRNMYDTGYRKSYYIRKSY